MSSPQPRSLCPEAARPRLRLLTNDPWMMTFRPNPIACIIARPRSQKHQSCAATCVVQSLDVCIIIVCAISSRGCASVSRLSAQGPQLGRRQLGQPAAATTSPGCAASVARHPRELQGRVEDVVSNVTSMEGILHASFSVCPRGDSYSKPSPPLSDRYRYSGAPYISTL